MSPDSRSSVSDHVSCPGKYLFTLLFSHSWRVSTWKIRCVASAMNIECFSANHVACCAFHGLHVVHSMVFLLCRKLIWSWIFCRWDATIVTTQFACTCQNGVLFCPDLRQEFWQAICCSHYSSHSTMRYEHIRSHRYLFVRPGQLAVQPRRWVAC